jgi:tripartite-type tricarboxylate transporter receptor subunit TctC
MGKNASLKLLATAALCGVSAATMAQNYPVKPVRIMVGVAAGGGADTTARMLGQALGELWATQVIIENRTGASGMVASDFTAKAPPDGYTLNLCNIATHAIIPARFGTKLTYDPLGDFAFLSMIGGCPLYSWCTRRFRGGDRPSVPGRLRLSVNGSNLEIRGSDASSDRRT